MRDELRVVGELVTLSNFLENDINDSYISWLNDPVVVRYSNQRFNNHSLQNCKKYLESFDGNDNLFLSIKLKENSEMIGTMTAYFNHHNVVDVGIMIGNKEEWGKGYGFDAFNTLINWLKIQNKVRKITAGAMSCNKGMINLMQKSGMSYEATRKLHEVYDGKLVDIVHYALFKG
jgi:RimJ/RimL family protein N-acetyltransferase